MNKVYYYNDEINDDFAGVSREQKAIPDDYPYIKTNLLYKTAEILVFRIIMTPIAFLYCKWKLHMRIENRKVLKSCSDRGFYLYGNHTQIPGDGYFAALVPFPKKMGVVVNPDAVAIKGTENFMRMLGAMPIPSNMRGLKNMEQAMEWRIQKKQCMVIYPEAHIWPYYTGIRPFSAVSFRYPVKFCIPSFCFTTTYQKRKHGKRPRTVIYVDGPFYPDEGLHPKKQQEKLRNEIFKTMCERAKNSNTEFITYRKLSSGEGS